MFNKFYLILILAISIILSGCETRYTYYYKDNPSYCGKQVILALDENKKHPSKNGFSVEPTSNGRYDILIFDYACNRPDIMVKDATKDFVIKYFPDHIK